MKYAYRTEPVSDPVTVFDLTFPVYATSRAAYMASSMIAAKLPDHTWRVRWHKDAMGWVCDAIRGDAG